MALSFRQSISLKTKIIGQKNLYSSRRLYYSTETCPSLYSCDGSTVSRWLVTNGRPAYTAGLVTSTELLHWKGGIVIH